MREKRLICTVNPAKDHPDDLYGNLWRVITDYSKGEVTSYELEVSPCEERYPKQAFNPELFYKGTLPNVNTAILEHPYSLFLPDYDTNPEKYDPLFVSGIGTILRNLSKTRHCRTQLDSERTMCLGCVININSGAKSFYLPVVCTETGEIYVGQATEYTPPSYEEIMADEDAFISERDKRKNALIEQFISTLNLEELDGSFRID